MKNKTIFSIVSMLFISIVLIAQNDKISTALLDDKFPDFKLQTYQGQEFQLSKLQGKNVLLVVSRGQYADSKWCAICNYQYAYFADLEIKNKIQNKYNMEIVFILPYNKDTLYRWEKDFIHELGKIEKWKYPTESIDKQTQDQKNWAETCKKAFPKTFTYKDNKVTLPIPILMDGDHEVAKGLDLFRTEWDECKTAQNIPAVFIIDKDGILRFKYISQNTFDRPSPEYIINYIDKIITK